MLYHVLAATIYASNLANLHYTMLPAVCKFKDSW